MRKYLVRNGKPTSLFYLQMKWENKYNKLSRKDNTYER